MSGRNLRVNLVANTSQFKSAMSETSNQIKLLNSEFRNVAAETDKYGNKLDSTGAKKKQLNGVIEQYRVRIEAIKNEQKHWTQELEKGNITEKEHAQIQQDLARRLNNTEAEMKRYEGQLKKLNAEGKNTKMTFEQFDKQFRDVGRTLRNVGTQVGITSGIGFMAMKRVLGDVIKVTMDFETEMSKVQALSGATGDELEKLAQQAKDLGAATVFSAKEAADAQSFLAMAGFNVNQIYEAMPGLLDLAASSQMDLGRAADIASNIISGFGMEAEQAGKVADVLAHASSNANTNVEQMGDSMATVAPIAATLGMSLEDMAAGTMIMSDAGIQGSQSGRMLRQGLIRLSKPTGEAQKLIKKLGINVFDANGNMKSLDKVVAELDKGLKGMSSQSKAAALATLFGSESTAGWSALLAKGSKTIKNYTTDLKNAEGAAKRMADTMKDNLMGSVDELESAFEGLQIKLGEALLPTIRSGVDRLTGLIEKIDKLDDSTIETIARLALLTTGVLGVTTAVAGLVAGVGAFMAFAGPVGLAITGGTLLLGGLTAAIYENTLETRKLAEEQRKAEQDARRYGKGLSEGTLEAVKGYVDLYEGAKLKMLELRNMSGDEARKTSAEIVQAFSQMADQVIAELEVQKTQISNAIDEVLAVAGETGVKKASALTSRILEELDADIAEYKKALDTIKEAHNKYANDIAKMPEKFKEEYLKALDVMEGGTREFAKTQEEMLALQQNISARQGTIMFEDAQGYYDKVNDIYKKSIESANKFYSEKHQLFEQQLAQGRITEEEFGLLMAGVEAKTSKMLYDASKSQEESLKILSENIDNRGKLLDIATGEEFKRLQIRDAYNQLQTESDVQYLSRWLKHTQDTLKAQGDFSKKALDVQKKNIETMLIEMGHTKEDARKIAKELVDGMAEELSKGEDEAKKAGQDKGKAHKDGLESTKFDNEKSAKDISNVTDKGLKEKRSEANKAGSDKGTAFRQGLDSTKYSNERSASSLSTSVASILGKAKDGGGGKKAGDLFASGIRSKQSSVSSAATSVAKVGERGLRSVSTSGAGSAFVSGFRGSISSGSGSIWSAAWNLGKTALNALRRSIDSHSPSREAGKIGFDYVDGFSLAIDENTKEAVKSSRLLGRDTLDALSDEINRYKHTFAKLALGIEQNKEALKIEHEFNNNSLENKISSLENALERLIQVISKEKTTSNKENIIMNIHVRNDEDINRIDDMLGNLANRRNAAWGGNY